MDEFSDLEGDPATIRRRTGAWGRAAGRTGDAQAGYAHSVTLATTHWRGPRKVAFTDAAEGVSGQLDRFRAAFEGGIGALDRYASRLEDLQDELSTLRHQARSYDERIEAARYLDPVSAETEISSARSGRLHLVDTADSVRHDARQAAHRAAEALEHAVDLLVPGGAHLSPDLIRQRVHALIGVAGLENALAAGTLTAAQAWAGLAGARAAAPTPDWKLAAVAYGVDFPATMDANLGRALKARLDTVLENAQDLDPGARARLIRTFANSLSEPDRLTLAYFDRMRVGNLDGIPNNVRYVANRFNIADGLRSEEAKLAAMVQKFGAGGPSKGEVEYVDYQRLLHRIDTLNDLVHSTALGDDPEKHQQGSTETHGAYQVLAFEPPRYDGFHVVDDGRLAVVIGDLDRAAHVGVIVPGITNRIDNFAATFDKAENTQGIVRDSATIAWLGYDTPEFADSVTTDDAEIGGAALASFVQGIQRGKGSDLTIMAHSYGTLATSKALQAIARNHWELPDRVVLFGSPGLGENVHTTADLGLPERYPIYALRAPGDPEAITAAHGTDPCDIPGITQLATAWTGKKAVSGHSAYTSGSSGALANIGGVLAGWRPGAGDYDLKVGGSPLASGFAGEYNANIRNLVDRLQQQVDARTLSRFIASIEGDLELAIERKTVDDPSILIGKVWAAAQTSGLTLKLTEAELKLAIIQAGFTNTAGRQTDHAVTHWVRDADALDGVRIPVPGPGIPYLVRVPDGANELVAGPIGHVSGVAVRGLGVLAVAHLPSLTKVVGVAESVAVPYDFAQWANSQKDTATEALGDGRDFLADRYDDGKDAAGWALDQVGLK